MYEDEAPLTLSEIYHQADSCRQTTERAQDRTRVFEQFLPLDDYSDIIITGCGSSHHLAICASFAWSEMLARPVMAVASSELAHFTEHYLSSTSKPLVIAISRSGGTTEVKLAVEKLRREYAARSLAIIGDRGEVGDACDAQMVFTECRERSVVMTQAFTCMLTGLYLLADGASGSSRAREISQLPLLINRAISATESLRSMVEDDAIDRFFFLGSGAMKGLADECALKMTEMALESAFSHRTLEFRHGPIATLNSTDQVVVFPTAAERHYLETLLGEIAATGAQALVVDSEPFAFEDPRVTSLVIPQAQINDLNFEVFRPALYAHVGQLFAYWRAAIRDLNPDAPRHLARTVLLDV